MPGDTIATLFSVCRLRGRGFDSRIETFFFTPFFSVSFFPPFFFLHARSAISMLKHFSSYCGVVITVFFLSQPVKYAMGCSALVSPLC